MKDPFVGAVAPPAPLRFDSVQALMDHMTVIDFMACLLMPAAREEQDRERENAWGFPPRKMTKEEKRLWDRTLEERAYDMADRMYAVKMNRAKPKGKRK